MSRAGQYICIVLPSSARAYVFGSVISDRNRANDIDVLVVYDRGAVSPGSIYQLLRPFASGLSRCAGLPVHLTVLTQEEEAADDFIRRLNCVPLHDWIGSVAP
jgi:predicted nucleotidyltransferase